MVFLSLSFLNESFAYKSGFQSWLPGLCTRWPIWLVCVYVLMYVLKYVCVGADVCLCPCAYSYVEARLYVLFLTVIPVTTVSH